MWIFLTEHLENDASKQDLCMNILAPMSEIEKSVVFEGALLFGASNFWQIKDYLPVVLKDHSVSEIQLCYGWIFMCWYSHLTHPILTQLVCFALLTCSDCF